MFSRDANYSARTDKINDFFTFDADQNWQIERHYQDCISLRKRFGEKHIIIGDAVAVKNGWLYAVWGTSRDPNTWVEQNTSLEGAPKRQLKREEVLKLEKDVIEE